MSQRGSEHHDDCEEASFHLGHQGQLLVKCSLGCPGVSHVSFCLFSSLKHRVVASWREDLPFGHYEQLRQTAVAPISLFGQVMEAGLNCQPLTAHTCEDACPTHLPQATLWKVGGFSRTDEKNESLLCLSSNGKSESNPKMTPGTLNPKGGAYPACCSQVSGAESNMFSPNA